MVPGIVEHAQVFLQSRRAGEQNRYGHQHEQHTPLPAQQPVPPEDGQSPAAEQDKGEGKRVVLVKGRVQARLAHLVIGAGLKVDLDVHLLGGFPDFKLHDLLVLVPGEGKCGRLNRRVVGRGQAHGPGAVRFNAELEPVSPLGQVEFRPGVLNPVMRVFGVLLHKMQVAPLHCPPRLAFVQHAGHKDGRNERRAEKERKPLFFVDPDHVLPALSRIASAAQRKKCGSTHRNG